MIQRSNRSLQSQALRGKSLAPARNRARPPGVMSRVSPRGPARCSITRLGPGWWGGMPDDDLSLVIVCCFMKIKAIRIEDGAHPNDCLAGLWVMVYKCIMQMIRFQNGLAFWDVLLLLNSSLWYAGPLVALSVCVCMSSACLCIAVPLVFLWDIRDSLGLNYPASAVQPTTCSVQPYPLRSMLNPCQNTHWHGHKQSQQEGERLCMCESVCHDRVCVWCACVCVCVWCACVSVCLCVLICLSTFHEM